MSKLSFQVLKNIWYTISALLWEPVTACLAAYNLSGNVVEAYEKLGRSFQTFAFLYCMCLLAPLFKLIFMKKLYSTLRAAGADFTLAVSIASRTETLLAFETSMRTKEAFGSAPCLKKRIQTICRIALPEDCEAFGLSRISEQSDEYAQLQKPASKFCRCRSKWQEAQKVIKAAQRQTETAKAFWCGLFPFLAHPMLYKPPCQFPYRYTWFLKLKMWSSIFHLAFYFLSVSDETVAWNSPTWLIKACMAFLHLVSLRRASCIRNPWSLGRFGVLEPRRFSGWRAEDVWTNWSRIVITSFSWEQPLDWWQALDEREQMHTTRSPDLKGGASHVAELGEPLAS